MIDINYFVKGGGSSVVMVTSSTVSRRLETSFSSLFFSNLVVKT